ncbi:MAG: adenylosuccinate lyase [Bacteroidota bacterium]
MADLNKIMAISPVDGRYRDKTAALGNYFSEYALMKYRVRVEAEYFLALCNAGIANLSDFPTGKTELIRVLYRDFTPDNALRIKEIEKITNHDVKAVEYYLKEQFVKLGLEQFSEFIHFGLTSQDINNTAVPLSLKEAMEEEYYPLLEKIIGVLNVMSDEWDGIAMLARTHGQPASPTRLGKEIRVFVTRLEVQLKQLKAIPVPAKFGGATGNFNAHAVAYPGVDWYRFGEEFVNGTLGLHRSWPTTQIEHYDNLAAIFHAMLRINTILTDLSRDMWSYISMEYFRQKIVKGEIGSSAMPHKVNPIDFENAEGNLGMANALLEFLAAKLPVSRLQRDLTDSTVLRNVGVPVAHSLIAFHSLLKGLGKVLVNEEAISTDLEKHWVVVAEALQTILRREGYPKPYEALLELTRTHGKIDRRHIHEFIDSLAISSEVKDEMKKITPWNYTGI